MSDCEMAPSVSAPVENNQDDEQKDIDVDPEEYEMLDAKLDDLNSALDAIEQKNDRIQAEFAKLLQSNREIREEIKKQQESEAASQSAPKH